MDLIQRAAEKFNSGESKTLHLCNDFIKDKISAAVKYAYNKSSLGKGISTSDMTPAQTVLLCLLYSLISDDTWFSCLLIGVASNIKQIHLKYPTHWLMSDFTFKKEDILKAVSSLSKIMDLRLVLVPQYLVDIVSCLANKYGVAMPKSFFGEGSHQMSESEEGSELPVRKIPQTIRLQKAVENNDPESIMVLVAGGADVHQLTESGDDLLHLSVSKRLAEACNALLVSGAIVDSRFGQSFFTPLHVATRDNSVGIIKVLLKFHANVKQRTETGDTMLHIAVAHGSNEVLMELLKARMPVLNKNHFGEVPLHTAARHNNIFAIKALLERDTPANIENNREETPLDIAVSLGHLEATKVLLEYIRQSSPGSLADLLNTKKDDEHTLLFKASKRPVIRLLVESGADIHATTEINGYTPLHSAALKGLVETCATLIELGAMVDMNDKNKQTPMCLAAKHGRGPVIELLATSGANVNSDFFIIMSPLFCALSERQEDIAIMLLQKGASINHTCGGSSPLHVAACKGLEKVTQVLISLDAFLEAFDSSGFTPLAIAAKHGQESVLRLLIKSGAEINSRGESHETPLILAIMEGHEAVVKALLQNGANPIIKDTLHFSMPLHYAAQLGHKKIVEILLDAGVDVNSKGKNNSTALHFAAANGRLSVVKLLLERGANFSISNDNDQTAQCVAENNGQVQIVELFLSRTTNIN